MVESTGGPITPNNLSGLKQRAERLENQNRGVAVPEEIGQDPETDRFEPSEALTAQESADAQTQGAIGLNPEQNGSEGSEGEDSPASITNPTEAGLVVEATVSSITFDAAGATLAQGNLQQDRVLDLIA